MANIDLNDPTGFARATMQDVGQLGQLLGFGGGQVIPARDWDLLESSYASDLSLNSLLAKDPARRAEVYKIFHVFRTQKNYGAGVSQVQDSGGRRVARYKFPYRDGQTTDDLGREPEEFTISCIIHGDNYQDAFFELLDELQKPSPGTFVHPVRGSQRVKFVNYKLTHSHDQSKAVAFELTFTEHSYGVADFTTQTSDADSFPRRVAQTTGSFAKINAILTKIETFSLRARQALGTAKSLMNKLNSDLRVTIPNLASGFIGNGRGIANVPGLLPVQNGGTGEIVGAFPVDSAPDDPFFSVPTLDSSTQGALAADALTKEVNTRRQEVSAIIDELSSFDGGQGSLDFQEDILSLRTIAIDLQLALEAGLRSSAARVINYVTPRDMTLREVAFDLGLKPDRAQDIDLLNIELPSTNLVVKGTSLRVPTV